MVLMETVKEPEETPLAPYATPSTEQIPRGLKGYIAEHNASLLKSYRW